MCIHRSGRRTILRPGSGSTSAGRDFDHSSRLRRLDSLGVESRLGQHTGMRLCPDPSLKPRGRERLAT